MSSNLPKSKKPLFELDVPSTNTKHLFRPFVAREEKILLIAQESGNDKDIVLGIKQVINNCIQDEQFDVNTLTTFDLEYLFLKLRSRSVNNVVNVSYRDLEDEQIYDFDIDLEQVKLIKPEYDPTIMVDNEIGVKMKYPSITIIDDAPVNASPGEVVEYMIRKCIDVIFDGENVYPITDYTDEQISEWLEDLDSQTYSKIRKFFDSLPKMYYCIEYTNSKGTEQKIELTTLNDFFTWG